MMEKYLDDARTLDELNTDELADFARDLLRFALLHPARANFRAWAGVRALYLKRLRDERRMGYWEFDE